MPRKPRGLQLAEHVAHHVMNRGHNREAVFGDAEDMSYFLGLLRRYHDRFSFRLYHYCLMSNHLHLLMQLDDPRRLSALMAGLLLAYARYFNRRYRFVGHLWQGRFKSPAVQREQYWLSCGRYIERNPLEAGLVKAPWDYPWSSCRYYALGQPNALLAEDPCFTELSPDPNRRQVLWREFLLGEDMRESVIRRQEWAIGDADFCRALAAVTGRPLPARRRRPPRDKDKAGRITT
jgi:putative transposase